MKVYMRLVMLIANIVVTVFTLIGLYGGDKTPVGNAFSSSLTFVLPVLILLNVVFLFYWILRRRIYLLLPLLTIACCYRYIGTIYQFGHAKGGESATAATFATYNVRMFKGETTGVLAQDIKNMLFSCSADVICFQEYNDLIDGRASRVSELMKDVYPYHRQGESDMVIYSRYPILQSKSFHFEYSNNSFMWADVKLPGNKVVRVFNVHMQTTGINSTLHSAHLPRVDALGDSLSVAMPGNEINNSDVYQALLGNYVFSLAVRSGQSHIVANEKLRSPHPIVLCGDFNDVPYSYTYHTLLGNLSDGFVESGHGFMYTYRGAKGIFRIDYIFHDPSMRCLDYYKLDCEYSDHNPVVSRIEM